MSFRVKFIVVAISLLIVGVLVLDNHKLGKIAIELQESSAQTSLPTKLLQSGDVSHLSSFTVPAMTDAVQHWTGQFLPCEYAQGVIGFNAANNSLFIVCHDWSQSVAEISIPATGGTSVQKQQPREVVDIQSINNNDTNSKKIGGLFVTGGKLLVNAYSFYDANISQHASLFMRDTNLAGSAQGPVRVGSQVGFTSGYIGAIPTEWQSSFGGTMMIGQCCLAIISRTSSGPAASVFSPGSSLANPTAATELVGYPLDHATIGGCVTANALFNCASSVRGAIFVPGTKSVLFIGTLGKGTICYKCNGNDGYNASSYEAHVWAYDANDLLAVKNGSKQPWDIQPYANWALSSIGGGKDMVGGAAFDPATSRLYVVDKDDVRPIVHVYSITGGSTTQPPPPPVSNPIVGDINLDHIVNSLDWSVMNTKWFTSNSNSDLNKDGIVNSLDFSIMNTNWFKTW